MSAHNKNAFLMWGLALFMGYCFGGLTGMGIVSTVLFIIQGVKFE